MIVGFAFLAAAIVLIALACWLDEDFRRAWRDRFSSRGPWTSTRSGARWYPWAPSAEDVRLSDLGAIAWINRWGGHAGLCTVAEHSVRVAELLARGGHSAWTQLQGAMHDAAEVYPPGDVPSPVLAGPWWMTWPIRWQRRAAENAVRDRLHLPRRLPPAVRSADSVVLTNERTWCMPSDPTATPSPYSRPERWDPDHAEWRWWTLVGQLAERCAAEFKEARTIAANAGLQATPEGWDQIVALGELAAVARREAERLRPTSLKAA